VAHASTNGSLVKLLTQWRLDDRRVHLLSDA
jgi:hypothetical protein